MQKLGLLLAVSVAQGAIGYIQYFNDIPALLVGFHIAGATAVWAATVNFYLGLFTRPAEVVAEPRTGRRRTAEVADAHADPGLTPKGQRRGRSTTETIA